MNRRIYHLCAVENTRTETVNIAQHQSVLPAALSQRTVVVFYRKLMHPEKRKQSRHITEKLNRPLVPFIVGSAFERINSFAIVFHGVRVITRQIIKETHLLQYLDRIITAETFSHCRQRLLLRLQTFLNRSAVIVELPGFARERNILRLLPALLGIAAAVVARKQHNG